LMGPILRCQIGPYLFGTAACTANFRHHGIGFFLCARLVNEDLRTCLAEREGAGAPDAARCTGDQGGFTSKTVHD